MCPQERQPANSRELSGPDFVGAFGASFLAINLAKDAKAQRTQREEKGF